ELAERHKVVLRVRHSRIVRPIHRREQLFETVACARLDRRVDDKARLRGHAVPAQNRMQQRGARPVRDSTRCRLTGAPSPAIPLLQCLTRLLQQRDVSTGSSGRPPPQPQATAEPPATPAAPPPSPASAPVAAPAPSACPSPPERPYATQRGGVYGVAGPP